MATKALLTIEQYEQLPDTGVRTELVDGEVLELATGTYLHNIVRDNIREVLNRLKPNHACTEVEFRTSPDRVRRADAVWFDRLAPEVWSQHLLPVPQLVVEVVSPSDSAPELRAKVHEYLDAGVTTVWLVYPEAREADIWNRAGASHMGVKVLSADCLPGFAAPVESVLPATDVAPPRP